MNDSPAGEPADVTMHVIPAEECYVLLGTQEIGRLGLIAGHYPLIFPVNYALDGTALVIRTHAGTILQGRTCQRDLRDRRDRPPCPAAGACWSAVRPKRSEGHRAELVARTHAAGVEPWAPGDKGHWIRIIPHEISGRRIVPGELLAWTPAATSDPALGARSVPVLHRPRLRRTPVRPRPRVDRGGAPAVMSAGGAPASRNAKYPWMPGGSEGRSPEG